MKSPKDQATIQIEITNACQHSCSNCTRFCGHHRQPYFMDFETFKRAVDSLEGYEGTIGMMGGEPTLHPEFERFTRYLQERIPRENRKTVNHFIYPQRDFMRSLRNQELENIVPVDYATGRREAVIGAGLWSAMVPSFKKHYELIQDVYRKQVLNDHNNMMLHQPILITRKELGIPDDRWLKLREQCWVNRFWSASITPKGCFFCEIAAALDRLFDGPGGWPIQPGWWRREGEELGDQLHWCELCGIPLETFTRDAREELDDVSPVMYRMLEEAGSPKLRQGKVNVLKIENHAIAEESMTSVHELRGEFYAESYYSRFNTQKSVLFPESFEILMVGSRDTGQRERLSAVRANAPAAKRLTMISEEAVRAEELPENVVWLHPDETLGRIIGRILEEMSWNDYLFVISDQIVLSKTGCDLLAKCVINPGTLHYIDFGKDVKDRGSEYIENAGHLHKGFAALLHKNAGSLKRFGFDRMAGVTDFSEIAAMWEKNKVVEFSPAMDYMAPENYFTEGFCYAMFGTGGDSHPVFERIQNTKDAQVVCVVDSNVKKQGRDYNGLTIEPPDVLPARRGEFDRIVIASTLFYAEMKEKLYSLGFSDADITML